jgi:REP element-mobilizing transposase RayT
MPRRPRSLLPDGLFHVGARGTGGIFAFLDSYDRDVFADLLYQFANKCSVQIYAWTVLGTHYHLVVDASVEQLTR